jgi:enoyl-CoA hydratase
MEFETIKFEKEDGFVLVTLNRPERLNALNVKMWNELQQAMDLFTADSESKVIIYTGAPRPDGRPCFCAGADLKEMAGFQSEGGQVFTGPGWTPVRQFWDMRKPKMAMVPTLENVCWCPKITMAAIDGICTAGGIELALSCDLIVVSETAKISDMHLKNLGWIGGAAANANMSWRVGVSKALELCLTGDPIDGKEAHRIGLANRVFPPDRMLEGAKALARQIAQSRLAGIIMTKATCRSVEDMGHAESWHYCDDAFMTLQNEPDSSSFGAKAWVEGREK